MKKHPYTFFHLFLAFILIIPAMGNAAVNPYRIGIGDILILTIYAGGEKQDEVTLTVSGKGMINAPFIGSFKAKGLTPSQLEARITEPLAKDYFVNPKVNIQIKEYRSLHYYISGAVKSPGLYNMTTVANLLVLIAKAGGVLPQRGNLAYILRGSSDSVVKGKKTDSTTSSGTEPLKVDLKRLLDQGDMSVNLSLEPGDVVYIPLKESLDLSESKIYVEGEVKKPGAYNYQPGMTAMNACIMAGGFGMFAAPNRTRVIRKKGDKLEIIKINLNRVKNGKTRDIKLKPGDRIHVPESWL